MVTRHPIHLHSDQVLADHHNASRKHQRQHDTHALRQHFNAAHRNQRTMAQLRQMCATERGFSIRTDDDVIRQVISLIQSGQIALTRALSLIFAITDRQMDSAFPKAQHRRDIAQDLNSDLPKYGLDTVLRKAHFFAQLREESGPSLDKQVEGFQYPPERLKTTFAYYKKHPHEADTDGYSRGKRADEQTIANKVYAGRLGNGNIASGDGWTYRGRGLIQITGRGNYGDISKVYSLLYGGGVDLVANPDLLAVFPYTLRSAVCFWISNGLPDIADHGAKDANVDEVTAVVNKHTQSYAQRRTHFRRMISIFEWKPQ